MGCDMAKPCDEVRGKAKGISGVPNKTTMHMLSCGGNQLNGHWLIVYDVVPWAHLKYHPRFGDVY
jgi:hypothetical protein